jgi:hypothetical protein
MTLNRSGCLGAALIGLMLFWDRRGKGLLVVGFAVLAVIFLLMQFGSTEQFDRRMQQTVEGVESDQYRRDIFIVCLQIGFDNFLVGVSPQQLPFEIGRRTSLTHRWGLVDPHNVFGHLIAGSGLFCFAALLATGWMLWNWKPRNGIKVGGREDPLRDARYLVRMMLVLWVVRGFFTREILYNPSFCIAVGLCIGLCLLAELERESMIPAAAPARGLRPAGAVPPRT